MSWYWPRDDAKRSRWRRRVYFTMIWLGIGAVVNVLVAWTCVWYAESKPRIHTISSSRQPQYPYEWIEMDWPCSVPSSWPRPTLRVSRSSRGYLHEFARNIVRIIQITRKEPASDGVLGSIQEYRRQRFFKDELPIFERRTGMAARSDEFDLGFFENHSSDGFVVKNESREILREVFSAKAGWPCLSLESIATQTLVSEIGDFSLTGQVGIGPHMDRNIPRGFADILDSGIVADFILPASVKGRRTWTLPISPIWPGFAINTLLYAGLGWTIVRAFLTPVWFVIHSRRRRRELCVVCAYPIAGLSTCPECGMQAGKVRTRSCPSAYQCSRTGLV